MATTKAAAVAVEQPKSGVFPQHFQFNGVTVQMVEYDENGVQVGQPFQKDLPPFGFNTSDKKQIAKLIKEYPFMVDLTPKLLDLALSTIEVDTAEAEKLTESITESVRAKMKKA